MFLKNVKLLFQLVVFSSLAVLQLNALSIHEANERLKIAHECNELDKYLANEGIEHLRLAIHSADLFHIVFLLNMGVPIAQDVLSSIDVCYKDKGLGQRGKFAKRLVGMACAMTKSVFDSCFSKNAQIILKYKDVPYLLSGVLELESWETFLDSYNIFVASQKERFGPSKFS
jgi:hypothetical protein